MLRTLCLFAAACSSSSTPPSGSSSGSAPQPTYVPFPIGADITGFMRTSAKDSPVLAVLEPLAEGTPCWSALQQRIAAAYQLEFVEPVQHSYFVFDTDVTQTEAEDCVRKTFGRLATVRRHGELSIFELESTGPAFVAWRGRYVIAGTREDIDRATGPTTPGHTRWIEHLGDHRGALMYMRREDELARNLFGVPTRHYELVIDRAAKEPKPHIVGRLIMTYASEADAKTATERIARDGLDPVLTAPGALASAFKRMKQTRTDTTLQLAFDIDTFEGIDLEMLQRWVAELAARR